MYQSTAKENPSRILGLVRLSMEIVMLMLAVFASCSATAAEAPLASGCEVDYPPFCVVDDTGKAKGFSVELLRAALDAMGREVTFRTGTWEEVRGWFEEGKIDVLPLVGRTPERESLFDFTFPYLTLHGAIVVREGNTDIQKLDDLRGRQVAVMKADNAEEFLRQEDRGMELITTPTFAEALRELSEGRYDAVVIQRLVALRLIAENNFTNLTVIDKPIEGFRQDFCFAVAEGDRDTLALLNEGLSIVMADGTHRRLHAEWFAAYQLPSDRPIVVGGDFNYPPYEFLNKRGFPTGYCVELTRAIAAEMGLDIEIRLGPWSEILKGLEAGDIDVMQGMFYLPERDLKYDFTQPHDVSHYVSVTRKNEGPPPASITELADKRIVVQEGDAMHHYLLAHGLGEQLSIVASHEAVLRELAEGKHDCALAGRISSLYLIEKNDWTNLQLGQQPFESLEYCYAVRNGQNALLAQFSEGLKILENNGEYRRIHDKWLGVYRVDPPPFLVVLRHSAKVLIPLILLLLLVLLWSWSLRRQVAARTAELRDSLDQFQYFFESANVGKSITRPDGAITANQAYAEFLGYEPSELNGKTWQELTLPEDVPAIEAELAPLLEGSKDSARFLKRYLHKDGTCVWADVSTRIRRDDRGKPLYFVTTIVDVTQQKVAVEALRAGEEFQRAMIECSPVALYSIDLDGIVLSWNQSAERVFGWNADEVIGKRLPIVPEDKSAEFDAVRHEIKTDGGFRNRELTRQKKDGTRFPLSLSVSPIRDGDDNVIGIMAAAEDITERKQGEEREQHLVRVLHAIRNVNQLITHEKDRKTLLASTCAILTGTRGYRSAWIGLTDVEHGLLAVAQSGLGVKFQSVRSRLECGDWPTCCREAMDHPESVVIHNCPQDCGDCPIAQTSDEIAILASALKHGAEAYGVLVVGLPPEIAGDPDEQALFQELVDDIGYALHGIEMEHERAKAQCLLEESERFARATIDALSTNLCVLDEEGTILSVNRAWREFAEANGVNPEEVSQNANYFAVCEAASGEDRECALKFAEGMRSVLSGERREFLLEYPCHSPSEHRWFIGRVTRFPGDGPVRLVVAHENVSKRKRAEDALVASEAQYRLLADNTLDVIWTMSPDFEFTYVNPAVTRLTGHLPQTWIGSSASAYCTPACFTEIAAILRNEMARGPESEGVVFTTELIDAEGASVPVEIHAKALFNAKGKPTSILGVARDITERNRLEQEREKLHLQLNQARKIEAIGQLAGGVAHDFNNILQAILGYGTLLFKDFEEGSEHYDYLVEIIKAGERAAGLTRQLLAFSRRQVLQFENLDLNEVVRSLSKMVRRLIGEHIAMQCHEGEPLGVIRADRGQMEQVLLNLCVNARDAMPEGGTLTIETQEVVLTEEYCAAHAMSKPGAYVLLSVTDSGCGMDEETQERIFEPFYTTKGIEYGTGLGLATVYGIVTQHNGIIQVYSEVDQGTTFKIYLPVVKGSALATLPSAPPPPTGGTETILLAEDDPPLRALCERVLRGAGYTVLSAANGYEAMEIVESDKHEIALALLDVVMPKMGGRAVCDTLRAKNPDFPILLSSGYSTNAVHTGFVMQEGIDFLQKPYSPHVLLRKVREVLDKGKK